MSFTTSLRGAGANPSRRARMPPALRAYQYNLLAYKRTWRGSVTTTFLYPVLYLAAIGVGLGFGLQNIISNFISGLIILAERPIAIGDRVEIGGVAGQVLVYPGVSGSVTYPSQSEFDDRLRGDAPARRDRRLPSALTIV